MLLFLVFLAVVAGVVFAGLVTIYLVCFHPKKSQNAQRLQNQQQLEQDRRELLPLKAVIEGRLRDLGTKLRLWFMVQPCSRCHEFKMRLLEISPNGRSVHYECTNCKKKMRAPATSPDASALVEELHELSTMIKRFDEKAYHVRRYEFGLRLMDLGKTGSGVKFENVFARPELLFESPAAPLPYEQTTRTPIPEAIRSEVWRRDSGQCVQCGSKQNLQFDHIIPVSRGGATSLANLQLLCQPCNGSKGNKI